MRKLHDNFSNCNRIVSFGCSITFGDELSDIAVPGVDKVDQRKPSNLTYAALIAKHCGKPYLCKASSGAANNQIERVLVDHIRSNTGDGVIIGWTSITRQEFHTKQMGYQSILAGSEYRAGGDRDKIQQAYDTILGLSEYPEMTAAFNRQVFLVQNTLKQMGIPYLMVHTFSHTNYTPAEFAGLDIIDIGKYHSFYDWATTCSYSKGKNGHPLDAAHADYAAKIIKVYG